VRNGRHAYPGFRQTIKLVGTGPRGSRDLSFEEARDAVRSLLAGEATPAQAGAFLLAIRVKGESPQELAGFTAALREAAEPLVAAHDRPLVGSAGAYDGVADAPHLSLAAAVLAAACGAGVVTHCGNALGPKYGVTQAAVLAALGGPAAPTPEQSRRMLEASGATVVHTPSVIEGWARLAEVRDEVGVRGPLHAAERLLDFFSARRFVVAYTHSSFPERLLGALAVLGAERAVVVRGIEGSDVVRPGRPTASDWNGPLDLPEDLGRKVEGEGGAEASAEATRAVLAGEAPAGLSQAVGLSAAVRLYAAGLVATPAQALPRIREAIDGGGGSRALEAMLGAA
jgi:anthranilate phosphoribosyltransferase